MAVRTLTTVLLAALVLSMLPGRYVAADSDAHSLKPSGRALKTMFEFKYTHPFLSFSKSLDMGGSSGSAEVSATGDAGAMDASGSATADVEASGSADAVASGSAGGDSSAASDGGSGFSHSFDGFGFKKTITIDKSG